MKKIARIELLFLTIGVFTILQMGCSKKGDTEYYPLSDKCWHINNWTGLQPDSMLNIDTLLDIPTANQDYVAWLSKKENHVLIRSLITENYEDLKCLDQYLMGVRIVQLGESNHYTKEYNLIKVRLIKYLHKVHGYNVIAFENGFFDCSIVNANFESINSYDAINTTLYNHWRTEEVLDLYNFIKQNTDPKLNLTGFDCQDLLFNNNVLKRAQLLQEFVSYIDPGYAEEIFFNDLEVTHYIHNHDSLLLNKDSYEIKVNNTINFIESNYNAIQDSFQGNSQIPIIVVRSLYNTLAFMDEKYYMFKTDSAKAIAIRDSAMASNIAFISEVLYPNEKIIIWAHNSHVAYNLDMYSPWYYSGQRLMGNWLYEYFYNKIYTIGLYSLRGEFGYSGQTWPLELHPSPNSLENICYHTDKKYLFFDIKNHPPVPGNKWFDEMLYARIFAAHFDEIYLRKEYDGVIFLDKISIPDYLY